MTPSQYESTNVTICAFFVIGKPVLGMKRKKCKGILGKGVEKVYNEIK